MIQSVVSAKWCKRSRDRWLMRFSFWTEHIGWLVVLGKMAFETIFQSILSCLHCDQLICRRKGKILVSSDGGAPVAQWAYCIAVPSSSPAPDEISTVNGVHPPIVLIWPKYCWKDVKSQVIHPSSDMTDIRLKRTWKNRTKDLHVHPHPLQKQCALALL